jgi:hypothetical protein
MDHHRIAHTGYTDERIATAIGSVMAGFPKVLERRDEMRRHVLSRGEQNTFARSAIELRFDGQKYAVEPTALLAVRHSGQLAPNLWNTFNVVQENAIRGGIWQRRADGSRIRSRRVQAIAEEVRLNRALWRLAEETARRAD